MWPGEMDGGRVATIVWVQKSRHRGPSALGEHQRASVALATPIYVRANHTAQILFKLLHVLLENKGAASTSRRFEDVLLVFRKTCG